MNFIAFILAIALLAVAFYLHRKPNISKPKINELNNDVDYRIPQEVIDAINVIKRQHKSELRRIYRFIRGGTINNELENENSNLVFENAPLKTSLYNRFWFSLLKGHSLCIKRTN
ncbi:hypothetical protein [Oenococcus sp.]